MHDVLGIIHRDIKPSNMLLVSSSAGGPICGKISDLGFCVRLHPNKGTFTSCVIPGGNGLVGTPGYRDPTTVPSFEPRVSVSAPLDNNNNNARGDG